MKWEDLTEDELREKLPSANGEFHLLCSFLALLPIACTVKDPLGRVLYANRPAMKLYNAKPNDMLGQTIGKILRIEEHRDQVNEIKRVERRILKSGRVEIVFQQLGELTHPMRHSVLKFPFYDSDEDPVLVSLVFATYPKQLEKEPAR